MSTRTRAILIAMAGPAIQAVGFVWEVAHVLIAHFNEALTPRHILLEPPLLTIFVGTLVTAIAVPVSFDVLRATEDEVRIPAFAPEEQEVTERRSRAWEALD